MLTRVWQAGGGRLRDVADESYAVTLWAFLQLEDQARIARFVGRAERLDLAGLLALAHWAPKELERMHRDLLGDARGEPDRIRDKEQRMVQRLRALQRRRRSPSPASPTDG